MVKVLEYFHYEIARFIITYENFRRLKGNRILESQSVVIPLVLFPSMCYRRALRATRPLRLLALSKRGRVSIAGGQLQVHVCTRLYGPELRGRHRRMRQEPVQTRLLQEHSRIVQVSRRTTSLTLSLSLFLSLLYISSFDVNCALTRRFPIKRRGRRRNRNWAASSFLFFSFHGSISRTIPRST